MAGPYVDDCSKAFELNLGQNITVGGQDCSSIAYITSSSLSCLVAPGVGQSHDVHVSINGNSGVLDQGFSYDLPRTVEASPSSLQPSNGHNISINITGKNFGLHDSNLTARIGVTFCGTTSWVSDTMIVCFAARGFQALDGTQWLPGNQSRPFIAALQGVGSVDVKVHVASQETPSGPLAVKFNYTSPKVTAVVPLDSPGTGGVLVTFYGQNFGMADYSPTGKMGTKDCLKTEWQSDSMLVCQAPRAADEVHSGLVGAGVEVAGVSSDGDEGETADFHYLVAPRIDKVEPNSGRAIGGDSITISGSGFGSSNHTVIARINSEDCTYTQWRNSSSLVCKSPAGVGAQRSVGVEVRSATSWIYRTKMNAFNYKPPIVSNMTRGHGPTTGAVSLTIIGE
ncbi:MAG: IPT/TIG domain-containing protein, partial [Promethearchaeia archaeon]